LWKHSIHGSGKMPHSTSPIGTDIHDPASELPRMPLLGTSVNKGKKRKGQSGRLQNTRNADATQEKEQKVRAAS
jgi:hypothetical protein